MMGCKVSDVIIYEESLALLGQAHKYLVSPIEAKAMDAHCPYCEIVVHVEIFLTSHYCHQLHRF